MRPPISLAYHAVRRVPRDQDPYNLAMHPDRVRRHVAALRRWGYRLVTFGDLAAAAASGTAEGLAALTFDDGLADNLHELVPILDELMVPATVFVAVGLLGGAHPDADQWPMLTEAEVGLLAAAGVEIGNHGWDHVHLCEVDDLAHELADSRVRLQELSAQPVDVFAYPFGEYDDRVVEAVRAAGHRAAATTTGEGSWDDPLRLPRQNATRGMSITGLRLRLYDRYEPIMRIRAGRGLRRVTKAITARHR